MFRVEGIGFRVGVQKRGSERSAGHFKGNGFWAGQL